MVGSLAALGLATSYHKRSIERRRRAKYSALTGEGIEDGLDDLELGEGPGLGISRSADEQETGIVSIDGPDAGRHKSQSMEEELDNWDENQPDDWDADDDDNTTTNDGTNARMTPATSSADSSEEPRKKLAAD